MFKYLGEIFMKAAYSTNSKSNLQKLEDCIFQFGTFSVLYHRARHFDLVELSLCTVVVMKNIILCVS